MENSVAESYKVTKKSEGDALHVYVEIDGEKLKRWRDLGVAEVLDHRQGSLWKETDAGERQFKLESIREIKLMAVGYDRLQGLLSP